MSQRNHVFYPWKGQLSVFYSYCIPELPLLHPWLALDLEHRGHRAGVLSTPYCCTLSKAISYARANMEKES